MQLQLKPNYYAHRNMFPTGGSLTVSQLYKVRFLEDKLLKLAKNGQNQRVQTQFRPNILREMPGVPFRSWLPQYFVQNLDDDMHCLHVLMFNYSLNVFRVVVPVDERTF